MKTKYIEKETAQRLLKKRLMECALNNVGVKADADEVFRDIAENRLPVWIDELQTYDVQEVRHGHWEFIGGYGYQYRCSKCFMCAEHRTPYCAHCRAKMYEEVEEFED